ncbi:MAG: helix-turn-helix domain-containing protein [Bradymonadaceae bacterium]
MSSDTDRSSATTPGDLIREARKRQDLSLSDVAAVTRISTTRLRHLEADRWEEYSADLFIRGHLRSVAREVGLDPEVVLKSFERHGGERAAGHQRDREGGEGEEDRSGKAYPTPGSWDLDWAGSIDDLAPAHLAAAGLVLTVLVVAFGLLSGHPATAEKTHQFDEAESASGEQRRLEAKSDRSQWLLEAPADASSTSENERPGTGDE